MISSLAQLAPHYESGGHLEDIFGYLMPERGELCEGGQFVRFVRPSPLAVCILTFRSVIVAAGSTSRVITLPSRFLMKICILGRLKLTGK